MVNVDVIKIKCPWCGAVLSVKNRPDIESKVVTCPVCKQKSAFNQYELISRPAVSQPMPSITGTMYAGAAGGINVPPVASLGKLRVVQTGEEFQLRQGRFVIGRKSPGSSADFQINTGSARRMSRQHIVINVMADPIYGLTYSIGLYKPECNTVNVNGAPLMFGDTIFIAPGTNIELPDATIVLEIPDPEKTIL